MTHPIQIRTPCPKRWDDLQGDERKRFCSECSLHVHNSAALTRREAEALVAGAQERVCMRLECDPSGAPVFRETRVAQLKRWALTAGTALLAACHGGRAPAPAPAPAAPPVTAPAPMGGVSAPEPTMGKVYVPEKLGDVAAPPRQPLETLGEAVQTEPLPPQPR